MKKRRPFAAAMAVTLSVICVVPFLYLLVSSMQNTEGTFSLHAYYQAFLGQTEYLLRFWKSVGLSTAIAAGQVVIATLAAYGFARFRFPGRNVILFCLMVLMILPLQVTLMPNFMVLEELGFLYTDASLIVPGIFVPLGAVIMTQSIRAVPESLVEAARLDGCNVLQALFKVVLPGCGSGLACTFLLSFLDAWNLVEQPITYLRQFKDYPISVALATVPPADPTVLLVCCMLVCVPVLFLFAFFNRELGEGVAMGGEK